MIARFRRWQRGASMIEFAIAAPLLALLLVGVIETGRYLAFSVRLSNAAHAGVQFGSQSEANAYDSTDIASAACGDSGFSCTGATPKPGHTASPDTMLVTTTVVCTYSDSKTRSDCSLPSGVTRYMYVQVATSGTFRPLLNYPFFNNTVSMFAQATQEVNQ